MGRYMGELQIARADLPSDPRVNVVGKVAKDHMMFRLCGRVLNLDL